MGKVVKQHTVNGKIFLFCIFFFTIYQLFSLIKYVHKKRFFPQGTIIISKQERERVSITTNNYAGKWC